MQPGSDGEVPSEEVGQFLNAIYVAVEKMRAFGFSDKDFGGKIEIVHRKDDERANGRYFPKDDKSVIFYPPIRGAADYLWTIVHETMHRIWVKHMSDDARELWATLCEVVGRPYDPAAADALAKVVQSRPEKSSLWFFFNKHYGSDPELFRGWLKTKKVSDSFPSKYANADPAEAFAEVAANVILGRGHAGREMSRSGSIVRKVFLELVAHLRHKPELTEGCLFEDLQFEREQQDENFLQTQVDFGYLRVRIPGWVQKNIPEDNILKLEHRPHVTVYYGADKRDLSAIQQIVQDYGRPIRAMLGTFNIFEHEERDVLYIEVIGDSIRELHQKIAKLPNSRPPTRPNYIPHLTVAYLKKGAGRRYVGITPFRMVISARGLTVIDASGAEQTVKPESQDELTREPILMAGL